MIPAVENVSDGTESDILSEIRRRYVTAICQQTYFRLRAKKTTGVPVVHRPFSEAWVMRGKACLSVSSNTYLLSASGEGFFCFNFFFFFGRGVLKAKTAKCIEESNSCSSVEFFEGTHQTVKILQLLVSQCKNWVHACIRA